MSTQIHYVADPWRIVLEMQNEMRETERQARYLKAALALAGVLALLAAILITWNG